MRPPFLLCALAVAGVLAACSATPAVPSPSGPALEHDDARTPAASPTPVVSGPIPTVSGVAGNESAGGPDWDEAVPVTPYCDPAQDGVDAQLDLLDATDLKSAITGAPDDSGDVGAMNAAGADMRAAVDVVVDEWAHAREALDGEAGDAEHGGVSTAAVDAAFATYARSVDVWVRPEATIAAQAGSIAEYDVATLALIADPEVQKAAIGGAQALSDILLYTQGRCGTAIERP